AERYEHPGNLLCRGAHSSPPRDLSPLRPGEDPAVRRFLLLAVFVCVATAVAGGITLSTGQSDYTVQVGDEAVIPIAVENTLGADITGVLTQGVRFMPEDGDPAA